MEGTSIEKEIAKLTALCEKTEARRTDAQRLAEQSEGQRRSSVVKAYGKDDPEAKKELERLDREANAAHHAVDDLTTALGGLRTELEDLRRQQATVERIALLKTALRLCAKRAEFSKKITADAAALVATVRSADAVMIELKACVLRDPGFSIYDISDHVVSAVEQACRMLGKTTSDGYYLRGVIEGNPFGCPNPPHVWDDLNIAALTAAIEKKLAEVDTAFAAAAANAA